MQFSILNLYNINSKSLPDFDLTCKFLLIHNVDKAWLVFGALSEYKYHANLAAKFYDINDVPYHWVKKPDLIEIDCSEYKIKGGGRMRHLHKSKRLEFAGHSTAYGKFDLALLKEFLAEFEAFRGYEVIIGT